MFNRESILKIQPSRTVNDLRFPITKKSECVFRILMDFRSRIIRRTILQKLYDSAMI